MQNSLCVQILRSPILAALLHGTRPVGVSQTLRRLTEGATYIRPWQRPLVQGIGNICILLADHSNPETNCLVAIVHTKPIATVVLKLVALHRKPKCQLWQIASQNWLPWQHPLVPLDSYLTHDSYRPSEPIIQTASRSVQPFCRDDRRVSL